MAILSGCLLFFVPARLYAVPPNKHIQPVTQPGTRDEAIAFIDSIGELKPSRWWPNIKPALFLQNLKNTIRDPIRIYPGDGTNFCGYGALTYLLLKEDPLGYAKLIVQIYHEGKGSLGEIRFRPSAAIRKAAGSLRFKGRLDIHPAEQMWYLCLADRFKGYLNFLNRKYDKDDEDKLWASVNYAKFNRMVRSLLPYEVKARGADLFRPHVGDLYTYISDRMKTGTIVLFINNRLMRKKNHPTIKLSLPTHYIVTEQLILTDNLVTLIYWDYGGKTLLQLSPAFLKRIVFGITSCTKKVTNAR
ncbi:MAG: hypothetical protein HZA79_08515 [Sphingobacteriales bacterium]|nr:hypothetical protein [Sphingobacteriales bacterium]